MTPPKLRLACAAFPVTGVPSLDEFAGKMATLAREAAGQGADLLLLPEYACMELGAAYAGAGDAKAELAAVVAVSSAIVERAMAIANETKLWLVPGTIPMRLGPAIVNRAPLIAPDGRIGFQDKTVMTRFETESWGVHGGDPPGVFDTPWGIIGISICYDVEFPNLVRAQTEAGAWLVLAPSCTDTVHGFTRVQISARARAIENQCYVAVSPTVGTAPMLASVDENRGAAGIFGPADRGFAPDGIVAVGEMDRPGLVFADLDPERIEAVRADGAVRNYRDWPHLAQPARRNLMETR